MASSEALNLEAIWKAIAQHDANCGFPAIEIAMHPFEVERLGWDEIFGLPIIGDSSLGTGTFQVRCERDLRPEGELETHEQQKVPAGAEVR